MNEHKLFISHVPTEEVAAHTLQEWIEDSFLGHCRVHTSSSAGNMHRDGCELDATRPPLEEAEALLLLCSPQSLMEPCMAFEAGFAWALDIPVIACCLGGVGAEELPPPLSQFQAADLTSPESLAGLFTLISRLISISRPPRIDYKLLAAEINHCPHDDGQSGAGGGRPACTARDIRNQILIFDDYKRLMISFSQRKYLKESDLTANSKTHYLVQKLRDAGFLAYGEGLMDDCLTLTKSGRAFLVENKLIG